LWSIALFGFYLLWRALPGFYSRCKEQLLAASSQAKSQMINYWNEQPSSQKIKLASTLTASLSFLVFYAFS
jgi:hypothetical protein